MNLLVKDILKIVKGELISGDEQINIETYSIDTRTIKCGDMYISIKGEKLNGNIFIEQAFEKQAIGTIFQGEIDTKILEKNSTKIIIRVSDTIKAIQELAKFKRQQYDIPVVAVTGSVGKTSTKDLISSVLSQKYEVLKTEGNFNNHIRVTINNFKIKKSYCNVCRNGYEPFWRIKYAYKYCKTYNSSYN